MRKQNSCPNYLKKTTFRKEHVYDIYLRTNT